MSRFADQLRMFEAKTLDKMGQAVRQISLEVFSEVILISPVDSGRFRGNWQTAIGSMPSGTVELLDPSGDIVIAKTQGVVAGMKLGDIIYMVNNLPYAQRLENGWSQRAPSGMVRLTVQKYQPLADEIVRQIGAA